MAKKRSIKLKDNKYWDEASINHNFAKLIYNNTTTNGKKWSYKEITKSSGFSVGNKIKIVDNVIQVHDCSYVKISVKISFKSGTYNYQNDIVITVNENYFSFKQNNSSLDYIISDLIIPVSGVTNISLAKYTNAESDKLYSTEQDNYLCVKIIK